MTLDDIRDMVQDLTRDENLAASVSLTSEIGCVFHDSLDVTEFFMMVEDKSGVYFSVDRLDSLKTVGDVLNAVNT